jgi:hypothetical protein
VVQHEKADRRGEACVAGPCIIDFGGKLVQGETARGRDLAEGVPECGFEGHAGAVAVERERTFGGAVRHPQDLADDRLRQNP